MKNSVKHQGQVWAIPFIVIIVISTLSCTKNEIDCYCAENEYVGEYLLLPESRNSIPYYEDADIYFIDSTGNRVVFEFRKEDQGYRSNDMLFTGKCECDTSRFESYKATGDSYTYYIKEQQETLNISFLIMLSSLPFHGDEYLVADVMDISISDEQGTGSSGVLSPILVNRRELTDFYVNWYKFQPVDSLVILDKTFYNVYTNNSNDLYYNYDVGLIAFKDRLRKLWVYDTITIVPKRNNCQ